MYEVESVSRARGESVYGSFGFAYTIFATRRRDIATNGFRIVLLWDRKWKVSHTPVKWGDSNAKWNPNVTTLVPLKPNRRDLSRSFQDITINPLKVPGIIRDRISVAINNSPRFPSVVLRLSKAVWLVHRFTRARVLREQWGLREERQGHFISERPLWISVIGGGGGILKNREERGFIIRVITVLPQLRGRLLQPFWFPKCNARYLELLRDY